MRNQICNYCKDKRAMCMLGCKKYQNAQLKRAERRMNKRFGDDYKAEDRYIFWLCLGASVFVVIAMLVMMGVVRAIGELIL